MWNAHTHKSVCVRAQVAAHKLNLRRLSLHGDPMAARASLSSSPMPPAQREIHLSRTEAAGRSPSEHVEREQQQQQILAHLAARLERLAANSDEQHRKQQNYNYESPTHNKYNRTTGATGEPPRRQQPRRADQTLLSELIEGRARSWRDLSTVIVDIRNGRPRRSSSSSQLSTGSSGFSSSTAPTTGPLQRAPIAKGNTVARAASSLELRASSDAHEQQTEATAATNSEDSFKSIESSTNESNKPANLAAKRALTEANDAPASSNENKAEAAAVAPLASAISSADDNNDDDDERIKHIDDEGASDEAANNKGESSLTVRRTAAQSTTLKSNNAEPQEARAAGHRPPTFGSTPHKLTRVPYYSYSGARTQRNEDTVSVTSLNETTAGKQRKASLIPTLRSNQKSTEVSALGSRRPLVYRGGYSNISNLFPGQPSTREPPAAWWRRSSEQQSLYDANQQARRGKLTRFAPSSSYTDVRRPATARAHYLQPTEASAARSSGNSLRRTGSAQQLQYSSASMRRQNAAPPAYSGLAAAPRYGTASRYAYGGGGGAGAAPAAAGRPASAAAGYYGAPGARYGHRRTPSASSLHYGSSPRYGVVEQQTILDPDCPVHGYSPEPPVGPATGLSKSQQHLNEGRASAADSGAELLYESSPVAGGYWNGGGGGGGGRHTPANSLSPNAYYNSSARFGLHHGTGERAPTSLAPAGEQLRRILGYQPSSLAPRPIHLHPQWAYTRPFIHLLGPNSNTVNARGSPVDPSDPDAIGRPDFVAYNQLHDTQAIRAVDFHPSGEVYAVGSNSRALRICAYPADHELRHLNADEHQLGPPRILFKFLQVHRGSIYCVSFNPSGQLLATGSNDQTVHIVRYNSVTHAPDGDEYRLTMHDGTVRDLCFIDDTTSGSSLLLSAGGGDNKIYVTDCDTITPFQSMAGHTQMVMSLHHLAGANFVSASYDRTIRFWDLRTRACTSIISAPALATHTHTQHNMTQPSGNKWHPASSGPGAPVCAVRVDPSGRLLTSGHTDATCMLYDIRGAKIIQTFRPHDDEIRTVSFSPKSYYLLTGGYDGRIVLTDLQGDLTQPLASVCVADCDDKIVQSKWHPSDFTFVTTSANKTATLWTVPAE